MSTSAVQQLSSLRKLYAKAHLELQRAGAAKLVLEDRIRDLENENRELREKLGEHRHAG